MCHEIDDIYTNIDNDLSKFKKTFCIVRNMRARILLVMLYQVEMDVSYGKWDYINMITVCHAKTEKEYLNDK